MERERLMNNGIIGKHTLSSDEIKARSAISASRNRGD